MELPADVETAVNEAIKFEGFPAPIVLDVGPVSGGSIHNSCFIETAAGNFFLKYNHHREYGNFQAEEKGLALLRGTQAIGVPAFLA
ncbi:MAG: fructosamine kinase family protein, partial [Bacteroidota bacterium]